jgi:Spy/CpxP family protein refolding chaperone
VQRAADELQQLLTGGSATPEQIKAKLDSLRQLREALKQELAQARAQLQQVLTVKQEATLVLTGILE